MKGIAMYPALVMPALVTRDLVHWSLILFYFFNPPPYVVDKFKPPPWLAYLRGVYSPHNFDSIPPSSKFSFDCLPHIWKNILLFSFLIFWKLFDSFPKKVNHFEFFPPPWAGFHNVGSCVSGAHRQFIFWWKNLFKIYI